jgi:hypothetical protein
VETPDTSRRRVHPPLPPTRAAQGLYHGQIRWLPEPALPPIPRADEDASGSPPERRPCWGERPIPGTSGATAHPGEATALQNMRWATCPAASSSAQHTRAAIMTERCDSHHIRTCIAPWLPNRRARPCRPSLTGHFLPAHKPPVAICLNHGPPMAHAPPQETRDAMRRAHASRLTSSCTALPCPSADHPPH